MTQPTAQLRAPTVSVRASFLDAVAEFEAEGRSERTRSDQDLEAYGPDWRSPEGFGRLVAALRAKADEDTPRAPGLVPQTTLWWVLGDVYLGRLDVRHGLTPALLEVGGHIGYAVRPGARRRGHATAMLGAALPVARALGIDPALVTCDVDNVGSRRVVEANGGVLEDRRQDKLRFWVPTRGVPPEPRGRQPGEHRERRTREEHRGRTPRGPPGGEATRTCSVTRRAPSRASSASPAPSGVLVAPAARRPGPVRSPREPTMSKVDSQRAMREAKYARTQGSGGPSRREVAAAGRPPAAKTAPPVEEASEGPSDATAAAPTPQGELCGHKSMNGRACTREAGHAEKNHRYG